MVNGVVRVLFMPKVILAQTNGPIALGAYF